MKRRHLMRLVVTMATSLVIIDVNANNENTAFEDTIRENLGKTEQLEQRQRQTTMTRPGARQSQPLPFGLHYPQPQQSTHKMQPFMMNKKFHYATKPHVKQKSMTWYKMHMSNKMTMLRDPRSVRPIMGEYNRHSDEHYGAALPYGNNNGIMPATMKWKMMQTDQNNNVFDGMYSKGTAKQQRWMNMYKGMSNGGRTKGNIEQDMMMYDKKSISMKKKHLNKKSSPKRKRWANKSMGMGKGKGEGQMWKGKGTTTEEEK